MDPRAAALARLFHNVQEGVYVGALGPDGSQTVAGNAHLKAILGYPADTADADVHPFDADRFVDPHSRTALLDRLMSDGAVTNYLVRLRRIDQTPVWVEITGRSDTDADGVVHLDALLRDVSERKKLDDDTRGIYQQLSQAEKMASLGQTISGVAHELNNPLQAILTWAERLSKKATMEPSAQRGLEIILGEAERASRIVRQLLTFARKRQTTRAMIDVNQTVRETLALRAYEQHVSNITTIDALSAGLPQVFADGYQVQQVLLNLIINAEQAMLSSHGRGVLVVRTWHDQDHDSVVLEINDDGPGVPEEVQPKVFDPFFTTKEVGKGTGLGLAVAYAIVQEHGGRIRLESRAGGGASFFIELPVTGNASPAHAPVRRIDTDTAPGTASILLVEDEAPLAVAVADALRDNGYSVEHAGDGEQALQKVKHKTFDLILCDLKMPRVDGRAFYGMLQAAAPLMTRRVLFMTGDVAGTDAESFLESTGCRWLAKPFRLADLLRTVKESLGS